MCKDVKEECFISRNDDFKTQIEKFYKGKLPSSDAIWIGKTPKVLCDIEARELPIIMLQKNLRKSIREKTEKQTGHEISREIIEKLPDLINEPVLIVANPDKEGILLLTLENDSEDRNVVIAIHLEKRIYGVEVNEIKSIYGREELNEYLKRNINFIKYIDMNKVKLLPLTIEKQYLKAPITLDSKEIITPLAGKVKQKEITILSKVQAAIIGDIQASGFHATPNLVANIEKLNGLTGKENLLKDISDTYKKGCPGMKPEEKELVCKIADECRQQEVAMQPGAEPEPGE